jgi:ketosteroid isomerase-like protein
MKMEGVQGMTKYVWGLSAALVFASAASPVVAQEMDSSAHAKHQAHSSMEGMHEAAGAEEVLRTYRSALEARDADAMPALFADSSAIFENGKAEGSFANYMEHHLGPELHAIESFTFIEPTITVTRMGHMAYGYETYGYRIELSDGRIIEREGVATSVLSHDASGWKIVQYHSSSRAPRKS